MCNMTIPYSFQMHYKHIAIQMHHKYVLQIGVYNHDHYKNKIKIKKSTELHLVSRTLSLDNYQLMVIM